MTTCTTAQFEYAAGHHGLAGLQAVRNVDKITARLTQANKLLSQNALGRTRLLVPLLLDNEHRVAERRIQHTAVTGTGSTDRLSGSTTSTLANMPVRSVSPGFPTRAHPHIARRRIHLRAHRDNLAAEGLPGRCICCDADLHALVQLRELPLPERKNPCTGSRVCSATIGSPSRRICPG